MRCKEQILSEEYYDFIVSEFQKTWFDARFPENNCRQNAGEFYDVIYVSREQSGPITFGQYPYDSVPKCFTLLDVNAMNQSGIIQVQNFPGLELQGSNVMVGFLDTGLDYTNDIFRNLDGSTRVAGIWDQTLQEGNPPEGMDYGSEYGEELINRALQGENPYELVPSRDENGHGTFLASLAVGSANVENQFIGGAPDCWIGVVKLKQAKQYLKACYLIDEDAVCYQENDIMLGVMYLHRLAEQRKLPLVLCIALGTNQGSHTGSMPLASQLDIVANLAQRAVVIGAGNEAVERHHFLGRAENAGDISEVEIRAADNTGFCLEIWSDPLDIFSVAIQSPSGEKTYSFPVRSLETMEYRFVLEDTRIWVDYKLFAERLNAELIFLRFERPANGIWKVFLESVQRQSGIFHMWLPVAEFISGEVYFLESNPDYTLTEPGSALSGITVGFYDGNDNSVAIQSGRGYTRSMRIKPDFAAPGVNIKGLRQDRFIERTGSSLAAGITAGAAALLMEWIVFHMEQREIDSTQIRNLLILGAQQNPQTEYPNKETGYGRLNVYQTFEELRRI